MIFTDHIEGVRVIPTSWCIVPSAVSVAVRGCRHRCRCVWAMHWLFQSRMGEHHPSIDVGFCDSLCLKSVAKWLDISRYHNVGTQMHLKWILWDRDSTTKPMVLCLCQVPLAPTSVLNECRANKHRHSYNLYLYWFTHLWPHLMTYGHIKSEIIHAMELYIPRRTTKRKYPYPAKEVLQKQPSAHVQKCPLIKIRAKMNFLNNSGKHRRSSFVTTTGPQEEHHKRGSWNFKHPMHFNVLSTNSRRTSITQSGQLGL